VGVQKQALRAVIWPLLNPDTGILYCDRFSWREIEKEAGVYCFDAILKAIQRAKGIKRYALIQITPDTPIGCKAPVAAFLRLVQALGEAFGGERAILGIDVLCPKEAGTEDERAIAETFSNAFPHAVKFVRADSAFEGLIADRGIIVTQKNAADYADQWQHTPLRMAVDALNPKAVQQAIDNHIAILESADLSASNGASHAGHRFQMNAIALEETEGKQVQATISFKNAGTLPCYVQACFRLRLSGSDVPNTRVFPLPLKAADLMPGAEVTITHTLDTNGLPHGEYDVHVGLFCEGTDYPISFGIEGRVSDGYYEGRLILCR